MRGTRFGAAVAVACLLVASCSKSSSGGGGESASASVSASASGSVSASPSSITIGSDSANNHGEAAVSGKSSLEVEQDDFYFGPTVLTGSAGQKLTIELKNEGTVAHTFTIDSLNVDVELQPGETKDISVTFPKSGFTEFYCRFHRTSGMVGELTVS
jgi:plastocyanin